MQLSRQLKVLHGAFALAGALFLSISGVSGSVLVFRAELENQLHKRLFVVEPDPAPVTIDAIAALARRSFPDHELYRVRLPQQVDASMEMMLGKGGKFTLRAYADPYRATILGSRTAETDAILWLQSLHFDWLAGERGRSGAGVLAALLLVVAGTGIATWLRHASPLAARVFPRFRVRPARRTWGVHVAGGIWLSPLFGLVAVSAMYFAFHGAAARVADVVTGSKPRPPAPTVTATQDRTSLDEILRRASAIEPDARWTTIRLPVRRGQALTLNYVLDGDLSDLGANCMYFDPHTGALLGVERIRDLPAGSRLIAALVPLHFGTFGGPFTRFLWVGLGLTPLLFTLTGLAMRRRRIRQESALAVRNS